MALSVKWADTGTVAAYDNIGDLKKARENRKRFYASTGAASYLKADGADLNSIRVLFSGLPMRHDAHTIIWRGETAAFIVDNL